MRRIATPKYTSKKKTRYDPLGLSIEETRTRQFIKRQLIAEHGAVCALCGKPITNMKDVTLDHIIPVSRGGLTVKENCQLAHERCNAMKGNSMENSGTIVLK